MNVIPYREEYVYLSGQSILDMKQALEKFYDIVGSLSALFEDVIPESLISQGLKPSILMLCSNLETKYKINTHCIYQGDEGRVPENIEIMTYQIVQELIINIIKHANAQRVTVELNKNINQIFVKVTDNGQGFDKTQIKMKTEGGLNKIRAKLAGSDGWMSTISNPGEGTEVSVEINF